MWRIGAAVGLLAVIVAAVLAIAAVLSLSNSTAWVDLEVGECFDLAAVVTGESDADVFTVDTIDCDEQHDAEVVAVGDLNSDRDRVYPSDDVLFDEVDRACATLIAGAIDEEFYGIVPIAPDERTWEGRSGRFVCVAVVRGGGTTTGSALG